MIIVLCTVDVASQYKALRSYLNAFNVICTCLCVILLVIITRYLRPTPNYSILKTWVKAKSPR